MFKGIWRSIVRWWRSLLGASPNRATLVANDLPLLSDPDYEYLFMQLLEGVAHGWQQPRVIKFFHKVKQRAPKSQWMAWLNGFGYRLVNSPSPNEELARKMIQLSELDCGEVTTLAGEFGHQLLGRIYGGLSEESVEFLPELAINGQSELEVMSLDLEELSGSLDPVQLSFAEELPEFSGSLTGSLPPPPPPPEYSGDLSQSLAVTPPTTPEPVAVANTELDLEATYAQENDADLPIFGEVPPELRLAKKSAFTSATTATAAAVTAVPATDFIPPTVAPTTVEPTTVTASVPVVGSPLTTTPIVESQDAVVPAESIDEQVIGIEEFAVMLQTDPALVQEIAEQLELNTTDPQVVLDAVINQMQQQIQDGN
jgi:hypothetical protein